MGKGSIKEKILKLRNKGYSYGEIQKELNCSKSVINYHCKLAKIDNPEINRSPSQSDIEYLQKLYDEIGSVKKIEKLVKWSKTTISRYINLNDKKLLSPEEKREKNRIRANNERNKLKQKAIEYLGGCCYVCKYNKCYDALDFHHIDPSNKDTQISSLITRKKRWNVIEDELKKCLLLCSNCHREFHAGCINL